MLNRRAPRAARLYRDREPGELRLSPDGRTVGAASPGGDRLDLVDVAAARVRRSVRVPGGIGAHTWLPDGRSVLVAAEGEAGGLFAVDARDGEVAPLPWAGPASIVEADVLGAAGVLVRGPGRLAVVRSGRPPEPVDPGPDLDRWFLDARDRLCCGARWEADGTLTVLRYDSAGWSPVARLDPPAGLATFPVAVTGDGSALHLQGPFGAAHQCAALLDLATGRTRVTARWPDRDIDGLHLHPTLRTPLAARLADDPDEHVGLTPRAAADLRALRPLGAFQIAGMSADASAWLLRVESPTAPVRYAVWTRTPTAPALNGGGSADAPEGDAPAAVPNSTGTVLWLRRRGSGTPEHRLRAPRTYRTTARDGLALAGRLTLPAASGSGPFPAVLLVHGGPWAREDWALDPDVQWLAGHGYACLQVAYRGSEGRGVAHMDAGDRDWGGRMQDDLLDAVDWAAGRGLVDAGRTAIMGTSYGGYAALVAATTGPPVFSAAVAIAAPADLPSFTRPFAERRSYLNALFLHRLGHPDRDGEALAERSPLGRADRAHTPILLAHGARDALVPVGQARTMAAALAAHGKPHRLVVFPDEGHGIAQPANRAALARSTVRFLARHPRRASVPEATHDAHDDRSRARGGPGPGRAR
ncbi:alpha/beta fold hydrolase [Spirillospora sp. NPDC050679]